MIVVPDPPTGTGTDTGTPQDGQLRGRTTVAPRALNSLVCALTADIFNIEARPVRVDLSDRGGLLALTIHTPVRVAALNTTRHSPGVTGASGGTLIQQAANAQTLIRQRVTELTGAEVAHVTIWLSGIDTDEGSRVR